MPVGVVKTKRDEAKWNEAKGIVHKQYPGMSEDNDSFWKIVQTIYQNMTKASVDIDMNLLRKAAEISFLCPDIPKDVRNFILNNYFLLYAHYGNLNKSWKLQGRTDFQGLKISVENKKGSVRKWYDPLKDENGETKMKYPYGYIRLTEGADGEHVDCYMGPDKEAGRVYVVHQNDPKTGKYDEDKVMLGFNTAEEAKEAYLMHYDDPKFFGSVDEYNFETFKNHVKRKKGKITGGALRKAKYLRKEVKGSKTRYVYKEKQRRIESELHGTSIYSRYKDKWKPTDKYEDFVKENFSIIKTETDKIKSKSDRIADPKNREKYYKREIRDLRIAITNVWDLLKQKRALRKAVTVKKNYTKEDLKAANLRWVTVRGNHVLVQGMEDGSWVVVGGAEGKLTHFKIDKLLSKEEYKEKAKKRKEEKFKELSPEEVKEQAQKRKEEIKFKKEARVTYETQVKDILGLPEDIRSNITAEEMDELYVVAKKKVARAKKREVAEDDPAVEQEVEKLTKEKEKEKIKQIENQAMDVLANEFMGDSIDPNEKEDYKKLLDIDAAKKLLTARTEFRKKIKAMNVPKQKGLEKEVGYTFGAKYKDIDDELVKEVQQHIETQMNINLYENLNAQSDSIQKYVDDGVLESVNGVMGDLFGIGAVFSSDTIQSLGLEACVRIITSRLQKEGNAEPAKKALMNYARKNNMRIVDGALKESKRRFDYADKIREMAESPDNPAGILARASANGYALRHITRGQQVLGSAVGSLKAIAHLVNALDEPHKGPIRVDLGDDLARARKKAKKAGFKREEYSMRTKAGHLIMEIPQDNLGKFFKINEEMRNEETKIDKIKKLEENTGYIPPGMNKNIKLDPAQEAGLLFFKESGRVLLDFEAGIGKTAVSYGAIAEAMSSMGVKKTIIVTPAKLRSQMKKEASKFLEKELADKVILNDGGKEQRKNNYMKDEGIIIIGHDQLRTDYKDIKEGNFGMMVIDEIHEMTNPSFQEGKGDSGRFKGMMTLSDIPYKIGMSGTNIKNSKRELHKKINFIDPDHTLGSIKDFESRYKGLNQSTGAFSESANDAFRKEVAPWMFSQKSNLPVKNNIVELETKLTGEQKAKYKESERKYVKEKGAKGAASRRETRNYNIIHDGDPQTNGKIASIMDVMDKDHVGEKAVIHAVRKSGLRAVQSALRRKYGKGSVAMIDGDSSKAHVDSVKADFNDPDNPLRFIIGTKSLENGHNLQHGGTVNFHLDIPPTYASFDQRNKRTYRKKQDRDVTSYILRSDTPFDMTKMDIMEKKEREMKILGNPRHLESMDESGFLAEMNSVMKEVG